MASSARSKTPAYIAMVVVGLLVILVARLLTGGDTTAEPGEEGAATPQPREGCELLQVVASSEKAGVMSILADQYNAESRGDSGSCVTVAVAAGDSGDVERALVEGWDPSLVNAGVPRPDVWSPASSTWLELLRYDQQQADVAATVPAGEVESITSTTLVLGMPKPKAEALGWPAKQIGWGDIVRLSEDPQGWASFGHPEWGAFTLGKTNPNISTSGLAAVVGQLVAATGLSSDLTLAALRRPEVVAGLAATERAVAHYGDSTLTFGSAQLTADERGKGLTYISAIAMEEKSVLDYNLGNPSGKPADLGKRDEPKVPLVAVHPVEGTLVSDSPYIALDADWVTPAKQQGRRTSSATSRRRRSRRRSWRRASAPTRRPPTRGWSRRGWPSRRVAGSSLRRPGTCWPAARDVWEQQRKRARALLLFDVSGSMDQAANPDGTGESRMELAKQAAIEGLAQLSDTDELGLWAFTDGLSGPDGVVQELVPVGPLSANRKQLEVAISALQPQAGTPMYAATELAFDHVATLRDSDHITGVILLTDGKNEYPPYEDIGRLIDGQGSRSGIRDKSVENGVKVFGVAYSSGADFAQVEAISTATGAKAYDATAGTNISKVFATLLSNF
jgi:Ca-activated chloride channel family protein